jgi:hypothetical protein
MSPQEMDNLFMKIWNLSKGVKYFFKGKKKKKKKGPRRYILHQGREIGCKKKMEMRGIDPRTSRMLSERSTI